jgi:hypothetical protein
MIAREQIEAEVKRLDAVLARRGQWYEDEAAEHAAYSKALAWMNEEKIETDRLEAEALAAAEAADEEARRNDPNFKTKELFSTYRNRLKQKAKGD